MLATCGLAGYVASDVLVVALQRYILPYFAICLQDGHADASMNQCGACKLLLHQWALRQLQGEQMLVWHEWVQVL